MTPLLLQRRRRRRSTVQTESAEGAIVAEGLAALVAITLRHYASIQSMFTKSVGLVAVWKMGVLREAWNESE